MEPKPREARIVNCVVIPLYGACFLFFLMMWMDRTKPLFALKMIVLFSFCFTSHFLVMYWRQEIYIFSCRILRRSIRFFEFPYFTIVSLLHASAFLIAPFLLGMLRLNDGISEVFQSERLTMYVVCGAGAALVTAAISGFDIYPVNLFGTKGSLEHLIAITRDLIKVSNRILVIVSGSVIVAWVFKKIDFSLTIIYGTLYAVIGLGLGSSGVLGARVTDLLYMLAALEHEKDLAGRSQHSSELRGSLDSSKDPQMNEPPRTQ